jgi:hypothetical protein
MWYQEGEKEFFWTTEKPHAYLPLYILINTCATLPTYSVSIF